jgi:phosphoribosyl-AMP cyclohydrolase
MVNLNFNKINGLVPAIVQDYETGEILMLAFMNQEAWEATLSTGKATYFSRSRQTLWVKGETSGNLQIVKEILVDCDEDTVLLKVEQRGGAACHTGYRSCFYRKVENDGSVKNIGKLIFDPQEVYNK